MVLVLPVSSGTLETSSPSLNLNFYGTKTVVSFLGPRYSRPSESFDLFHPFVRETRGPSLVRTSSELKSGHSG